MGHFIIPPMGDYKKFTKDLIILILAKQYPLSTKKIRNLISKDYGISVTYQAVRKSINLLLESGILEKQGKEFAISKDWILEMESFIEGLQKRYFSPEGVVKQEIGDEITVYSSRNLVDLNNIWRRFHLKWLRKEKKNDNRPSAWWGDHCWWLLGQLDTEDDLLKEIIKKKAEMYWLNNGETFIDNLGNKYYTRNDFTHYKTNKNKTSGVHLLVIGDYILESKHSKELKDKLDEFYSKINDLSKVDLNELMKIIKGRSELKLTIMKNKMLAEQLRKNIISHFK
ncbi:hypothetical protein GF371_00275 [Candidatus Woesearchaeota archaeon]|nr:hypothetical protein [Candidatus Woesearchaeota archaeon]